MLFGARYGRWAGLAALCAAVGYAAAPGGVTCAQSRIEDRLAKEEIAAAKKPPKPTKTVVSNFDGGVFFASDGHVHNGACFRLSGELTAWDFFDGLRRVDTDEGTTYFHYNKVVTEFPDELYVILHLTDFPCSLRVEETAPRPPLTPGLLNTLRLHFYWKDGLELRPVAGSQRISVNATPLPFYAAGAASELEPRFQWNYTFIINSAGVPLGNDLVFVIRDEDQKIAARTAARM